MIKLTQKTYYGLKAILELAAKRPQKTLKANEIAKSQGISLRFLEVILNELKHQGLVTSKRGSDGGYQLALEPEDITLRNLLDALENPFAKNLPTNSKNAFLGDLALKNFWNKMIDNVSTICEKTTVRDMLEIEAELSNSTALNYCI